MGAVLDKEDGTFLAIVENNAVKLIPVERGVESDVALEVKGEALTEGFSYIINPAPSMTDGMPVTVIPAG